MTQEQIEAVMQIVHSLRTGAMFQDHRDAAEAVVREAITALQARVDEAERERDEARAWHQASQETLADQLEARSKLEAEVARLTKERDDEAKDANAFSSLLDDMREHVTILRTRLAAMQAAVDEAVSELENLDETFDYAAFCRALDTLRNLTKPETPSARIMSDKDRENPVEGAHPTQPEGEDALVEALREVLPTHNREVGKLWAANLRKALASRGLVVRGEGVER